MLKLPYILNKHALITGKQEEGEASLICDMSNVGSEDEVMKRGKFIVTAANNYHTLVSHLRELVQQVQEDCPHSYRTEHLTTAIEDATALLKSLPDNIPDSHHESEETEGTKALREIASMTLWGETLPDEADIKEAKETSQWDSDENCYNPCADTESSMLRDAVETARKACGMPVDRE